MSESKTMRRVPRIVPLLQSDFDSTGGLKSFSLHGRINWFILLRERPVCGHLVPDFGKRMNTGLTDGNSLTACFVACIYCCMNR